MRSFDTAALILIIIGGLNWGLVGLFDFNLVAAIFGEGSVLSRIIYILVGAAAVYELVYRATGAARRDHPHVAAAA